MSKKTNVEKVVELHKQGFDKNTIAEKIGLAASTVRTYIWKYVNSLDKSRTYKKCLTAGLEKASSLDHVKNMLRKIRISEDESLERRVEAYKKAVCIMCPHRDIRCNACPGKLIMNHYLGE